MAKVSPVSVMPYVWYCYLTLISAVIFAFISLPKSKKEDSYDNFEALDDEGHLSKDFSNKSVTA